jgi:opacity protein-like surface antigen
MELRMRKQFALGAVLALGMGGQVLAAEGISYNIVEAGYARSEVFNIAKGDTFTLNGSAEFGELLYGFAGLATSDYSGLDWEQLNAGIGVHWALSPNMDLSTGLSWERAKLKLSGVGSASDSGYGLGVGLRGRVGESVELSAAIKYIDLGGGADDTTFSVGGRYYFTDTFAVGVDLSDNKDVTSYGITFRFDFGSRD